MFMFFANDRKVQGTEEQLFGSILKAKRVVWLGCSYLILTCSPGCMIYAIKGLLGMTDSQCGLGIVNRAGYLNEYLEGTVK
jgi:hypothetical protein